MKFVNSISVGTYRISNRDKIFEVVDIALDVGYRHFDSAVCYRNESHIGEALKVLLPKYNLKREDIFITSKISKFTFALHLSRVIYLSCIFHQFLR